VKRGLSVIALFAGLFAAALYALPALCEVKFKAEIDRTRLYLGERTTLTIILEGEGVDTRQGVESPEVEPHFEIVNQIGPQVQTSMQIINGKFTSSSSWRMTYILEAREVGNFQIPPLVQRLGNRVYRTEAIFVQILEPPEVETHEENGWAPPEDPYLDTKPDKAEAYVGEQVVVSWYLYNHRNIYNLKIGSRPPLTEFKVEELETAKQLNPQVKSFNGLSYNVAFIQNFALFPLKSGKAAIGPLELIYSIPTRKADLFGRRIYQDKSLSSAPLSITVLPLPEEGRPPDFSGAVGEFSLDATLEKDHVRAQDSLNFTVSITGTGNIEFIKAPSLNFPSSLEVYPPEAETEKMIKGGKLVGRRTFKYILVPQKEGDLVLPGISFSYFDPGVKKYQSLESPGFSLHVEPARLRPASPVALSPDLTREEVKLIKSDMRYLKPDKSALKEEGGYLVRSPLYLGVHVIPLFAFFAAYYFRTRKDRLAADPRLKRSRQAHPLARRRLRRAKGILDESHAPDFYAELSRSLTQYFADRFQMEAPGLTSEKIEQVMKEKDIAPDVRERFHLVLSRCDQARFGAVGSDQEGMRKAYQEALRVISELEKSRK